MGTSVDIQGLTPLIATLKGPLFKDVNRELRTEAKTIAQTLVPVIAAGVAQGDAPQSRALAETVRAHSDRVPVVVIGKVNPKFGSGFRNKNDTAKGNKLRRGSLAHGVVYGPKGGHRATPPNENYYRTGRDESGGRLGFILSEAGPAMEAACAAYLQAFSKVMTKHGFVGMAAKGKTWNGKG